ncbi:MAG: uroporphyrinogen-III synthase [Proteobacteria bacterium]|nr:uroporphyrinogen-III synthase [Pseudomonadota bacterium]
MARALMRILVTRPIEDAPQTAKRLESLGHQAIVAPLLEIRFRSGGDISLQGVQAILATSANGVRALASRTTHRDVAVFAVGPQTSQAARQAGFKTVKSAQGDAGALAEATLNWAKPDGGDLLHAAASKTKGDLARTLCAHGFQVRTETLYEAAPVSRLPRLAARALQDNDVDAALFFSPRTASIFAKCVEAADLRASCARIIAACISEAAAKALQPLKFREIRVAAKPNQEAVLALIG